jgi:hypothetical protein
LIHETEHRIKYYRFNTRLIGLNNSYKNWALLHVCRFCVILHACPPGDVHPATGTCSGGYICRIKFVEWYTAIICEYAEAGCGVIKKKLRAQYSRKYLDAKKQMSVDLIAIRFSIRRVGPHGTGLQVMEFRPCGNHGSNKNNDIPGNG